MEILTIYHKFLRNSVPIAAVILLLQYNHMTTTFSKENPRSSGAFGEQDNKLSLELYHSNR